MLCLWCILNSKWQDKVPNTTILAKCGIPGIGTTVNYVTMFVGVTTSLACRAREYLNNCYMANCQTPSYMLEASVRDTKVSCVSASKPPTSIITEWETLAADKSTWTEKCYTTLRQYEEERMDSAKSRRAARSCPSSGITHWRMGVRWQEVWGESPSGVQERSPVRGSGAWRTKSPSSQWVYTITKVIFSCILLQIMYTGTSIPQQPRRYSPNFPFPLLLHFPFLLPQSLPPFPSCREAAPLKPARGTSSEAPADIDFGLFWERKKSFDSNYYVDFCILKFVKLLIKSPQIVLGAFVANIR